eukprot:m.70581 g.70581  ORF g.70581 m.70581 type:complete len:257 (+) comp35700_c0_seq5:875-1645(+)
MYCNFALLSTFFKTMNGVEDKGWMQEERRVALAHAHTKVELEQQEKAVKRREAERYALKQQMKREEDAREAIKAAKQEIQDQSVMEMEAWKAKEEAAGRVLEQMEADEKASDKEEKDEEDRRSRRIRTAKELLGKQKELPAVLPPTREPGKIQVSFTPRLLPTPMRESKLAEEEEWLGKMAKAGRAGASNDSDKDMTEKNPLWLRDKGNEFYKASNYLSAISAYTEAIRIDSTLPSYPAGTGWNASLCVGVCRCVW